MMLEKNSIYAEFKEDADGEAAITQENHYYPFGMRFSGEVFANNDNDFRYNGKELLDDFGLDWPRFQRDCLSLRFGFAKARQSQASGEYDYGARFYDPALGRWHAVDPLADKAPGWTPYRYGFNNPMSFIDPDGRAEREQTRESQQDIPWKAKNYSSFSIEGVGGLSASKPEISVILDFYDAISGAYIGSVEVSEEGETAKGSDEGEGDEGEGRGVASSSVTGPEFSGSFWDWANKINHMGQRKWTDPESGRSYYINDAGEITGVYPITGMAPVPGMGKGLKVLQTGGRTLSSRTLKGLNLSKDQGKRAIERMKKANGMRNDFHGKIYNNGDVYDDLGNLIDNILDYIH